MQNLEYERGLLELNEKLSIKTIEFNRKIAELEGTIIQKNEEMNVLTENIQNTINMNIELIESSISTVCDVFDFENNKTKFIFYIFINKIKTLFNGRRGIRIRF